MKNTNEANDMGKIDEEIVERMRAARREGRLKVGGLDLVATSEEELADLEIEGRLYGEHKERGIPILVRVNKETIEWLRQEAESKGERSWRKVLNERIEQMAKAES